MRAGLAAVPADAEIVVVHDAARPLAGADLFQRTVAAVRAGADAAIPGVPVTDTVKQVEDGRVVATVDRSRLVAVQTPQAFRAAVLRRAHAGDPEATDDAALVEALGGTGGGGRGRPPQPQADLARRPARGPGPPGRRSPSDDGDPRVGLGFDVHPFSDDPGRVLVLGGVVFEGERGLAGHSDADVVTHAVAEALLGAAGLGDLGQHFPDTDARWKGVDSTGPAGRGGADGRRRRLDRRQRRLLGGAGGAPPGPPPAGDGAAAVGGGGGAR